MENIFYQEGFFSVKNAAVYSEDIKSKAGIKALAWSPYKARNGSKYFYLDKQIQAKFDRANNTLRLLVPVKYLINPEGEAKVEWRERGIYKLQYLCLSLFRRRNLPQQYQYRL
ncbi:hypothetical protein WDV93_10980 [Pantoea ananatis]